MVGQRRVAGDLDVLATVKALPDQKQLAFSELGGLAANPKSLPGGLSSHKNKDMYLGIQWENKLVESLLHDTR